MAAKRILMLAWEYPPHIVGGLARVVCAVSKELVEQGLEVHVITSNAVDNAALSDLPEHQIDEYGVHVHRVKTQTDMLGRDWSTPNFITWAARLNFGILQYALALHAEAPFDVVHAHDWLVADAAWVLKSMGIPVVASIHATEYGRNNGIHNEDSRYIDQVEWRLIYEAKSVIVNSNHMLGELVDHFRAPAQKIAIIPNGIEPDRLLSTADTDVDTAKVRARLRADFRLDGPMMLFVGRLVHEKGVQVLLDAAREVLERHPQATFVLAGEGYYRAELAAIATANGINDRVRFFGRANDDDLRRLYLMADVLVVPSLYEPFGIVALEGMATGTPIVTSDSGGLMDIVEHEVDGITTFAGKSDSLAWGILKVLDDPALADRLQKAARKKVVAKYSWASIADQTRQLYDAAVA